MNELEKRMARELGNYLRAEIERRYFIPEAKPCVGATQELSPTAKLALWGAAVRLLQENRSFVDKACVGAGEEPETDPGRSHAA
jgi:hypothetical protein